MDTLESFLENHKHNKNVAGSYITHTKIPNNAKKIYGGSYCIPQEDYPTFIELYNKDILQKKQKSYLVEKQPNHFFAVDLDFRYDNSITKRQHTKDHIIDVVMLYNDNINKYVDADDYYVFVMEKPYVNVLNDKTKDGIHIIWSIGIERNIQKQIRKDIIKFIKDNHFIDDLPIKNTIEDVIDDAITSGRNNWLLYGSQKPADKYKYEITNVFHIQDGDINEIPFDLNKHFHYLCPQSNIHNILPLKEGVEIPMENKIIDDGNETDLSIDPTPALGSAGCPRDFKDKKEIDILLECCKERFATGKYKEWVNIGQVLKNEFSKQDATMIFIEATKKYGSDNKKVEAKEQIDKIKHTPKSAEKRLTIKSLYYWACNDNPTLFKAYKATINEKPNIDILFENIKENEDINRLGKAVEKYDIFASFTESDAGNCFLDTMGLREDIICFDLTPNNYKIFKYSNEKCIWEFRNDRAFIKNALSNDFVGILNKYLKRMEAHYSMLEQKDFNETIDKQLDLIKKKIRKIYEIITFLKKTQWKNNITSEILEICYENDITKLDQFNNTKYLIPFKNNKIVDLRTNEIISRTREHRFTFECDFNFIPYDETSQGFIFAKKYFNDLFCNNQETINAVLNIFKTALVGIPMRYVFFLTGEGRNGKSLLLKVLKKAFGSFVDTVSKLIFVKQKGNFTSTLNTEFEKLTKCRFAFVNELSDEDEANTERLKEITGGDPIDFRGMRQTNRTIIPTSSAFGVGNTLPKINAQQAVLDRLVNIPFNNRFNVDTCFEDTLFKNIDFIVSYIFHFGKVITGDLVLSDEMKASKADYVADNQEKLKEYMENTYNIDEVNGEPISINDIRIAYINWAKENHYKIDTLTPTKITKLLKSWGYETYRRTSGTFVKYLYMINNTNEILDV